MGAAVVSQPTEFVAANVDPAADVSFEVVRSRNGFCDRRAGEQQPEAEESDDVEGEDRTNAHNDSPAGAAPDAPLHSRQTPLKQYATSMPKCV